MTAARTRGRPKKAGSPPEDIAEEIIEDAPPPAEKRRSRPPGPKKVLGELGKAVADTGAGLLMARTSSSGKGLTLAEAQSVSTPIVRIIGRRMPAVLKELAKRFAPKVNVNPDDMADLTEIAVTIGKYLLRYAMLTLQEMSMNKEERIGERQARQATSTPPARPPAPPPAQAMIPAEEFINDAGQARIGTSSNGHNPAFAVFGADLGLSE